MQQEERFNFAKAASFFLQIKTAEYAPPDLTGSLEGKFLAPKEKVVQAITQLIENELKTGYAYLTYSNTLRGLAHHSIAEEFTDHASEETEHTDFLLRRLAVLAGTTTLPDIPAPPPATSPEEIIDTMIRMEQEGIGKWRLLRSLVGDENPMRYKIEEFLTREQHHLDELWQLRPHTPDARPAEKSASLWEIGRLIKSASPFPAAMDTMGLAQSVPPIPQTMTPAGSQAVERDPMLPEGVPQVPLPGMPDDVSPEQVDPQALQQLALEEQGRAQQQQASEAYYAEQATQAQQQLQQLQQQIQMQAQQAQKLQMQLQQEQAAKQQAQSMAQQSGEITNQALTQQLQAQQQAIQSRQLATQSLGQQEQFKQQLREVIDPPPQQAQPPGALPGQDPAMAQQAMAQAPQQGGEAPKVASIREFIRPLWDTTKDVHQGRNPALTIGLPVAAAFAAGAEQAYSNSKKGPVRVEEAKKSLEKAEAAYAEDKSYTNAMRLVAAKGMVGAQEIRRDYPSLAAAASMPLAYGAARTTVLTGYSTLPQIKKRIDEFRSIKPSDAPKVTKNLPPPTGH